MRSLCCDWIMTARPKIQITCLCMAWSFFLGCGFRHGNKVLIPDGYVGWVRIYYREAAALVLPTEGRSYVITVDRLGSAHTSTTRETGYGNDEYFYVTPAGGRTKLTLQGVEDRQDDMIHDFTYQSSPNEVTLFFVGSRKAAATQPRPTLTP